MRGKLFNFAAAVSLVFCLGTAVLWVRSYWRYDECSYGRPNGEFCDLSSMGGHIRIDVGSSSLPLNGISLTSQKVESGMIAPWVNTNPLGFRLRSVKRIIIPEGLPYGPSSSTSLSSGSSSTSTMIVFPNWRVVVLTAILPAVWLRRRRGRPVTGFCPNCSYNLTGNTSGVCPECGTLA